MSLIPSAYRIDWTNAGREGGIPYYPAGENVRDHGARGDGVHDDTTAIKNAIAAAADGTAIIFPPGKYKITSKLILPSNVCLRGCGSDNTLLSFDLGGAKAPCFDVVKYDEGSMVSVSGSPQKDDTGFTVSSASSFSVGDVVEIQEENDADLMYTKSEWESGWNNNWASSSLIGAVGQLAVITAINGNTLSIDRPLHIDFHSARNPKARRLGMVEDVGFEDFKIERTDTNATDYGSSNIRFKYARNCWALRIESYNCVNNHFEYSRAMNITVRSCYVHHADRYEGGCGYGFNMYAHTTDCLVEDCIANHLRHAFLVQVGTNGCVFAYNYSRDPYGDVGGSYWFSTDLELHGFYPFMNLYEGNHIQYVSNAGYWGPSGPGNTFLRNFIESKDIDVKDYSHYQNFLSNDLAHDYQDFNVEASVENLLRYSNRRPSGFLTGESSGTPEDGYFYSSTPDYFGALPWPPFGFPVTFGANTIPAKIRYETMGG